jgi:hypothetical protein
MQCQGVWKRSLQVRDSRSIKKHRPYTIDNHYLSVVSCSMVSLAVKMYRTYDELLDFDGIEPPYSNCKVAMSTATVIPAKA